MSRFRPAPQILETQKKCSVFRRFRPPGAVSRPQGRQKTAQDEKPALGKPSRHPGSRGAAPGPRDGAPARRTRSRRPLARCRLQIHGRHGAGAPRLFRHAPHALRRLLGSSTEGLSGNVRVRPRRPLRHAPHTFRGLIGSSTEGPGGRVRMRPRHGFRYTPHVSWPHRELHRKPQWQGPHASPRQFRHTPHTVRGPIGSSTEGPSGRVRMRFLPLGPSVELPMELQNV